MLNPDKILTYIDEQLHPIRDQLHDPDVTEIMVNPGGIVYVERLGIIRCLGKLLSPNEIDMALTLVAKHVNQDALQNTTSAMVFASLGDMRFAGAKMPICPEGSFLSIRKHQDKSRRPTLDDLIHKHKALTQRQADLLVDLVLVQRKNCIIAGGTGSGKTTLLNALLSRIPSHERIITIEDSREIQIGVPNFIPLLSNPTEGITARHLIKLALRTRPDRLVLGETRGDETYDLIRAFNSGHPGSLSTLHADTAESALPALEMLFQMSLPANATMPPHLVKGFIANSIHVVVFADKRYELIGEDQTVVRRIEQISLVKGVANDQYVFERVE
jgi:pilus assembly protein CpaF